MRTFARCTLTIGVASILLAGCGGSQAITTSGAIPQGAVAGDRSGAHRATGSGTYQQLYRFHPQRSGTHPVAGLLDVNGTLYGTTRSGGLGHGTVYTISASGVERVLYRFHGRPDGGWPESGLLNVNGTLYGTTAIGGSSNDGTVYSIGTSGGEKVLYSFKGGSDGVAPQASLIDVNGTLYGTTTQGGGSGCTNSFNHGCGTVFSITPSGAESVLYRFTGGASDGSYPVAELLNVKGVLYGTTPLGGCKPEGCGIVFSVTTAGVEKVLHAFGNDPDGLSPASGLINVNGTLYGTTTEGGSTNCADPPSCGTVYSITTSGSENVIYRFMGGADGAEPSADLIDVNGTLYGTTSAGGNVGSCFQFDGNCGTIFSVTTAGVETVLYRFTGGRDGWQSYAPLTNVNGTLYGTTEDGGDRDVCCHAYGWGTIFTLSP